MNRILQIAITVTVICLLTSCNKCCDSQLCLINSSPDSVFFGIGTNYYEDTIPPGQTVCVPIGEFCKSITGNSTSTIHLYSSKGSWFITGDDCTVERVFE